MSMKSGFAVAALALAASFQASATTVTVDDPAYGLSYHVNPAASTQETHILSVYETRSDHTDANNQPLEGTAYVNIIGTATGPVNLVLASYEPTNWVIQGAGASFINTILINGYNDSRVTGFDTTKVINKTGEGNYYVGSAVGWPGNTGGSHTPELVNAVENSFGSPVSSFSSAYRATTFTVNLSAVPEPTSLALTLAGAGLILLQRNRKKAA